MVFFPVKSAYRLALELKEKSEVPGMSSKSPGERAIWDIIWKANVPPKVRFWTIWNFQNEVIFCRCANPNFLQVIHRTASLIHLWSYLLPMEQREPLDTGCNRLMAVVQAIFSQGGWLQSRRIGDDT
jgi:two-component response regulator (ARR-B family)